MHLKPQDLMLSLKLLNEKFRNLTFAQLSRELGLSTSETHQSLRRAREAGLVSLLDKTPNCAAVAELLIHGLKYMLPVQPGRRTRGFVTGFAAPVLNEYFQGQYDDADILVWPDPNGTCAGLEIEPLVRSAPMAARRDSELYDWLVLADVLRGAGRARERRIAEDIVLKRLNL